MGRELTMLKNLGFVCFCLAATGALAWWVIPADRIDPLADVAQSQVRDQGERGRELDALVAAVDEEFQKVWQEKGLESASECPPDLIARRLSLALTGTIPSLEEIRRLEAPNRR